MKIIVYVEGPSDKRAMESLLEGLLDRLRGIGVKVDFIPLGGKKKVIAQAPVKAINIIGYDPDALVIAMPDLYPPNVGFAHNTPDELVYGLEHAFAQALNRKGLGDKRLRERFRIFCFKHDLEALLLAAKTQLAQRLNVPSVDCTWIIPVEDQDHNKPPKRIIERIFVEHHNRYQDTIDAPLILGAADYRQIALACPQCFKPFVDLLESLSKN